MCDISFIIEKKKNTSKNKSSIKQFILHVNSTKKRDLFKIGCQICVQEILLNT